MSRMTIAIIKQYQSCNIVACAKIYDFGRVVGYLIQPEIHPSFEDSLFSEDCALIFSLIKALPQYDPAVHKRPLYGFDVTHADGVRLFYVIDEIDQTQHACVLGLLRKYFIQWKMRAK